MELKEFVSAVLTQIVEGVMDAQTKVTSESGKINPRVQMHVDSFNKLGRLIAGNDLVQMVDFDVALTVTQGAEGKGGIGIFVAGFGVGYKDESTASTSSVSRIKFQVPITLPAHNPTAK